MHERVLVRTEFGWMHVRSVGSGPDVLFIHQNPSSGKQFRAVVERLRHRFRCVVPDLIGMGDSDTPDRLLRLEDHVIALEQALAHVGCSEPVMVSAHLGTYLAAVAVQRGHIRPRAMVFNGYPLYSNWREQLACIERCKPMRLDPAGQTVAELWKRTAESIATEVPDELKLDILVDRLRTGELWFGPLVEFFQVDLGAPLQSVRCPTRFVVGAQDREFVPMQQAATALVPGARASVIEGCGAWLPLENPGVLAELVTELASSPSAAVAGVTSPYGVR